MDLIHSYKSLLISLGMKVDDDGLVSTKTGVDTWSPTTVNGKRLVLPIREVLLDPDWEKTIAFHPLSEKSNRGESVIIKALVKWVTSRLTYVTNALMEELMMLAVDTDRHSSLSPKQLKALRGAPEATPDTLARLRKIIERVSPVGENRIINIFLKRGGELKGIKYNRVAVVSFPIAEKMYEDGAPKHFKELFGVSGLNKTDAASILGLLQFILPDFQIPETYNVGTKDVQAPYFHSLMQAYLKVAERLNAVTELMQNVIADVSDLDINTDWAEMLEDLSMFKGQVPPLEGNEGDLSNDTTTRSAASGLASSASLRVSAGVSGGGEERVPYQPATPVVERWTTQPTTQAPQEESPSTGKTSSWTNARGKFYGAQPPAPIDVPPPPPGMVYAGLSEDNIPVYLPAHQAAPVQQQPQQQGRVVRMPDQNGNMVDYLLDAYGNYQPMAPQSTRFNRSVGVQPYQQPSPMPYNSFPHYPMPYGQPAYGGYPPQHQGVPLSTRQVENRNRAGTTFPTRR